MKYIDAERLRMELEKRLKNVRDYINGAGMKYKGPKYFKAQGKESAYDALLSIIDSLQQEQQEEPDKSMEEAADDYIGEVVDNAGHPGWDWETHDIIEAFKAGAKWGIKSQEKMIADAYEKGKQEGIRVVRSWESSPGQGGY